MKKTTWTLRGAASAGVCLLLLAGCATPNRDSGTEDRDRYIDFCRELATSPVPEREDPDDFMSKPDWMVHPCSTTDQEFKKEYNVVYADRQYLSFRCSEYAYTGGAHGNTQITVGTIDRKTGKILTLADVPAFADRHALKRRLQDAVVMKIGKDADAFFYDKVKADDESVQSMLETGCFYLSKDGWHFVFNAYEVACYAVGDVEVVIPK